MTDGKERDARWRDRETAFWPGSPKRLTRRLVPLLEPVSLSPGQILYEARGPIEYAYFPTGAVLSALTVMQDGNAIEVATIGNEGLVGHYGFGGTRSPHRMIVQVENGGLRIACTGTGERSGERRSSSGSY